MVAAIFWISWVIAAIYLVRKKQPWLVSIFGSLLCAVAIIGITEILELFTAPSEPTSPTASAQLLSDADEAKIRAKEYVESRLKAPSTAHWPSYNEFAVARAQDKNGRIEKDVWQIVGYVDAQNSYSAKLRTKFLVTLKKTQSDWQLIHLATF